MREVSRHYGKSHDDKDEMGQYPMHYGSLLHADRDTLDGIMLSMCNGCQRLSVGVLMTPGIMPHGDGHVMERHGTDHPICVDRS